MNGKTKIKRWRFYFQNGEEGSGFGKNFWEAAEDMHEQCRTRGVRSKVIRVEERDDGDC